MRNRNGSVMWLLVQTDSTHLWIGPILKTYDHQNNLNRGASFQSHNFFTFRLFQSINKVINVYFNLSKYVSLYILGWVRWTHINTASSAWQQYLCRRGPQWICYITMATMVTMHSYHGNHHTGCHDNHMYVGEERNKFVNL